MFGPDRCFRPKGKVFFFLTGGPLAASTAKKKSIIFVVRLILPPGVLNVTVNYKSNYTKIGDKIQADPSELKVLRRSFLFVCILSQRGRRL